VKEGRELIVDLSKFCVFEGNCLTLGEGPLRDLFENEISFIDFVDDLRKA
jgi:hypothetical protein